MASIHEAGAAIEAGVKQRLGALYEQLSQADQELIAECSIDAAALQVEAMSVSGDAAAVAALAAEKRQIDAQFANLSAQAVDAARKAFWDTVQQVAEIALSVAIKAV